MTDKEYRNKKEYISFSDLKSFKSPYHFWNRKTIEQTSQMAFGCALHKYILEPYNFKEEYEVLNDRLDLRRTENKKLIEDITKTKKIAYNEDIEVFEGMLSNIKKHYYQFYYNIVATEICIFDDNQMIKGRLDAVTDKRDIIDL